MEAADTPFTVLRIGGLDLAAEWADSGLWDNAIWGLSHEYWRSIGRMCADGETSDAEKESFYEKPDYEQLNIISGGFPGLAVSVAGERRARTTTVTLPRCTSYQRAAGCLGAWRKMLLASIMHSTLRLSDMEDEGYKQGRLWFNLPVSVPRTEVPVRHHRCRDVDEPCAADAVGTSGGGIAAACGQT